MKKLLFIFIILLVGCEKEPSTSIAKVKSSQNFTCDGFLYEEDTTKNTTKVDYKMNVKKWNKEFESAIGKTIGIINVEKYDSFPICYENEFQYTFFPSCDGSSSKEKLSNSNHVGMLDKVSGQFSYKVRYDRDGVTHNETLLMDCKPIGEMVVK